MDELPIDSKPPKVSKAFHPLSIGNSGDKEPTPEQVVAVVSILKDAGICCFFVDEYALIYYGAGRVAHVCPRPPYLLI